MTRPATTATGLATILTDGPPVAPRPSASVLLIDRHAAPWTVLMTRRPRGADFAPDAYVFPGGSVHSGDAGLGDERRAAALRELFEEAGILLARGPGGRFASGRDAARLGASLAAGADFGAALAAAALVPAFDRLTFLTRWITPEAVRRRFDTTFFLGVRPAGQAVRPQPGEVVEARWLAPAEALAEGGPTLVHATRRILESIAAEADPGRLFARARRRGETEPVTPRLVRRPDSSGFDVTDDATSL